MTNKQPLHVIVELWDLIWTKEKSCLYMLDKLSDLVQINDNITWSPWACLPITIGFTHPGTSLGTFWQIIGSRNTVPPKMLRIVPLGLRHIFFKLNSINYKKKKCGILLKKTLRYHSFYMFLLLPFIYSFMFTLALPFFINLQSWLHLHYI